MWPRGFWEWVLVLLVLGTAAIFLLIFVMTILFGIYAYE